MGIQCRTVSILEGRGVRLLHFLKVRNLKRFGDQQQITLDHPTVMIGPNNCGKTTAIQAIALWSQAVRTWHQIKGEAPPKKRTSTSLNRLNLVSVPVQRTRYLWHNTRVRQGSKDIPMEITLGIAFENDVLPVTMRFRNQGEDLIYCTPSKSTLENPDLIKAAAQLSVELLPPMSGLETEEPILQPGRIKVLLGMGQTAQVLRNLCLIVHQRKSADWHRIADWMHRLFRVELGEPEETSRGSVNLYYRQEAVKERLEVSLAGRGLQQMLLILAYLYSHQGSVVLIDEPDAHFEILRQRQVYSLLRDIAAKNGSQVVLATHSEVILDEAADHNLTLLLGGESINISSKSDVRNTLKYYGADHYVRAQQHRHVLYVEGRTDLENLRALADHLGHPVAKRWDERINSYYLRNNFPTVDEESELVRVEAGFGLTPQEHFFGLRKAIADLKGLAILDSDSKARDDLDESGLQITHWQRYECENCFVTPEVLGDYALQADSHGDLFAASEPAIEDVLDELMLEQVFPGSARDLSIWKGLDPLAAHLLWEAKTRDLKLSTFAEEFFRRLGKRLGRPMLLRKGELHRLVPFADRESIPAEVTDKLDMLNDLMAGDPGTVGVRV